MAARENFNLPHVFTMRPAGLEHLPDCCEALHDSEWGRRYFNAPIQVETFLRPGIDRGEIVFATNHEGRFVGFIWYIVNSSFYGFPVVQTIAVAPSFRSIGAGSYLIRYFEEEAFRYGDSLFALASAFNPRILRFYKRLMYLPIGRMPNLFIKGIDEILLMKSR